jgi:hypothetical protein
MCCFLVGLEDLEELMRQEAQAAEALEEIVAPAQALLERMGLPGLHLRQEPRARKQVEVAQQALELLVRTQQMEDHLAEDFHC